MPRPFLLSRSQPYGERKSSMSEKLLRGAVAGYGFSGRTGRRRNFPFTVGSTIRRLPSKKTARLGGRRMAALLSLRRARRGRRSYGRIAECANWDHGLRSASCTERRRGYGYGVSGASITPRSLARLQLSGGGRMPQVTRCGSVHAARVAAAKARPSSGRAGPAIISASIRTRPDQNRPYS
jgi:hypothetical protein